MSSRLSYVATNTLTIFLFGYSSELSKTVPDSRIKIANIYANWPILLDPICCGVIISKVCLRISSKSKSDTSLVLTAA